MSNQKKWFVIINPTSGNGSAKKNWPKIKDLLHHYNFDFDFGFTKHSNHSSELLQSAINKNIKNIISVGGDGTLHNIINGIMTQNKVVSTEICVGVIPIGTGNDWVKTHGIPNNIENAIKIIKNGKIKQQDIGKIEFINEAKNPVYFNNLAGVGFDGFVVSKVEKYKRFGALAYLIGTLFGLSSFKNFESKTIINSKTVNSKSLMVLVGLCNYSGGGMQLTKNPNPFDGLFDVRIAKDFSKADVIKNVSKLFNGTIVNFKKIETHKASSVEITTTENNLPYIQADGELIGKGGFKATVLPKSFSFYC
jgi:YegS/Rv2252/BmrU family lipid kinase